MNRRRRCRDRSSSTANTCGKPVGYFCRVVPIGIITSNRVVEAVCKYIIANYPLSSNNQRIGSYESAYCWIVITGLEIITPGLIGVGVAMRAFFGSFRGAFSGPPMGGKFAKFSTHQGHNQ